MAPKKAAWILSPTGVALQERGHPGRLETTGVPDPEAQLGSTLSRPVRAVKRRRFLQLVVLASAAGPAFRAFPAGTPTARPSAEEEGQVLAAELRQHPPALSTSGSLRRRDAKGRWLPALPVQLEIRGHEALWESLYRVFAPSGAWLETVAVSHAAAGGNQYTLRRASDASGQNLQGNAAAVPFAESDFWLCDLGLEFLHWPAQRIAKTEMRKGRSCRVLESTNPRSEPGAYARVLTWVDLESGGLMRAEAFDRDGQRMKEFNIGSLQKINGRFQLKSMEIRDARHDTRTRLEFELEIGE